jgi:hypothetical protein
MFALASQTGWPEHYLLWELPLARALQYWHSWLYSNGVWTVPRGKPVAREFEELQQLVTAFDEGAECEQSDHDAV